MSGTDKQMLGIPDQQNAAATTLHLIFRFLRTVRLRSGILVSSLVVFGILGAVYYITAERNYESNASMYIVRKGTTVNQDTTANSSNPMMDMPTFVALMSKEQVITRALQILQKKFRDRRPWRISGNNVGQDGARQSFGLVFLQHQHP